MLVQEMEDEELSKKDYQNQKEIHANKQEGVLERLHQESSQGFKEGLDYD